MRAPYPLFRIFAAVFAALILLSAPAARAARAQPTAAATALVTAVDASAFPQIQAYALVTDSAGQHLPGLAAPAFTLSENGQAVSGLTVDEAALGVQVVFVLDVTDAFKTRDANGVNRLEFVKQALVNFAQTDSLVQAGADDVTVLAPEGPVVQHSADGGAIAHAVEGYQSTFAGAADPLAQLNAALDFASDATGRPGMRRFVVLVSNGFQRADYEAPLADAAARAAAVQVPIYTVFVGPPGAGDTVPAQNLKRLAELTGGKRVLFEGPKSFDPLFQQLADQGSQYRLSYRSALAATGQNKLTLSVALPGGDSVSSNEVVFPLRIEPPMVALGDVPASLVRVAPSSGSAPDQAEPRLYDVPLHVDFPDGHPRGLALAQLIVDGEVAASQTDTASVASLAWPLGGYDASAPHTLQVRIADELGLAAESAVVTVNVSLQIPAAAAPVSAPARAAAAVSAGWPLLVLALGGVLLASAIGVGAWLTITRRRAEGDALAGLEDPGAAGVPAAKSAQTGRRPARAAAPAAEPRAPAKGGGRLPHVGLPNFPWRGRGPAAGPHAPAFLEVVAPGGNGTPNAAQPPIELTAGSLTLGRDEAVAETVFHDRSVSRLHARLVADNGTFRLYDAGSTSGTWVNYSPIAAEGGQPLEHGDLINLGRVQLRFQRRDRLAANGQGAQARVTAGLVTAAPLAPAAPQPVSDSDKEAE